MAERSVDNDQPPRSSMTERVAEQIEELILTELEPGASLPSEAELGAAFGVSRLTVREATRTVHARGLLDIQQGRRPRVAAPNGSLVGNFFAIALQRDPAALLELLELRRALELHSARLAASRATPADHRRLQDTIDEMVRVGNDREAFNLADVRFHHDLVQATGNQLLVFLIEALADSLLESRRRSLAGYVAQVGPASDIVEAHSAILAAVSSRDARRATKAMDLHLRQSEQGLRAAARDDRAAARARAHASTTGKSGTPRRRAGDVRHTGPGA